MTSRSNQVAKIGKGQAYSGTEVLRWPCHAGLLPQIGCGRGNLHYHGLLIHSQAPSAVIVEGMIS